MKSNEIYLCDTRAAKDRGKTEVAEICLNEKNNAAEKHCNKVILIIKKSEYADWDSHEYFTTTTLALSQAMIITFF